MTLNRVTLIGYISHNPELYQTDEGSFYACFSLVTYESWRDPGNYPKTKTQWHPVAVFGSSPGGEGENIAQQGFAGVH